MHPSNKVLFSTKRGSTLFGVFGTMTPCARSSSFAQIFTLTSTPSRSPWVVLMFVCKQLWRGSVRGSAAQGDGQGLPLVSAELGLFGSSAAGQLLSTGDEEHSWLSMNRTAGTWLLRNEVWSLPRPGRSSRSSGLIAKWWTFGTPNVAMKRMSPRAGEVLSLVPSSAVVDRSRGVPAA